MTRRTTLFIAALGIAAAAGCYTGPGADLSPAVHGSVTGADGREPGGGGDLGEAGASAPTGLPCDVAKVLETSCTDCHGKQLRGGAPNALVAFEDLSAPSRSEPNKSVAEVSIERMKATTRTMPPDDTVSASDIAVLERWVGAGMPRGACGEPGAAPDAGPTTDGGAVAKDASADAASVCTSATTWPAGTPASPLMHPGKQCIGCHSAASGPSYTIAGTVYPTMHEPNDCNGSSKPSLTVLVIDATGKTHTMPVNDAGNFYRVTGMPMPYRAMIVDGTKVREMKTPQTDGDCNGCHSELGKGSPGRIMAP